MALTQVQNGMLTTNPLNATNITSGTLPSAQLPTGCVLQVVSAVYTTAVTNSTLTLATTNLTASITPKFSTSKILVLINHNGVFCPLGAGPGGVTISLFRNSTSIQFVIGQAGYNAADPYPPIVSVGANCLDSPATTSSVTYSTKFALFQGTGTAYVNVNGETSSITLMEIAG